MPDESLPLVPLAGSQLARHGSGGGRILDDMVSSTLTTSQKEGALVPRYRIGNIDFCEPDYRQMLLWAEEMVMTPEEVLLALWDGESNLFTGYTPAYEIFNSTYIENGRLKCVKWDFARLPIHRFNWIKDLEIEGLDYVGNCSFGVIAPMLPSLIVLRCCNCNLRALEISKLKNLRDLQCGDNCLEEINLENATTLERLWCPRNNISSLDVSQCFRLKDLWCGSNQLVELNIKNLALIEELWCDNNKLTTIDLSSSSELKELYCYDNLICEIDLSGAPQLQTLWINDNPLSELDLSGTQELRTLWCDGTYLSELDIRPLQHLESLTYDRDSTRLIQRPDQDF